MKKSLMLSLAVASLLTPQVNAAEKEGVRGQLKTFYINRSYDFDKIGTDVTRDGWSVGGEVGYDSKRNDYGLKTGVTFYTSNKIDDKSKNPAENDPTVFGDNGDSYSVLGEAFIDYSTGAHHVKVGRQIINTPYAAPNNFRMLPNTFEGITYKNSSIDNVTLSAMHITRIQTGTFANSVPTNSASRKRLALLYGFGQGYKIGEFEELSNVVLGANNTENTAGLSIVGATFSNLGPLKITLWDFFLHDLYNTFYAQADYKAVLGSTKLKVAANFATQQDVGDNLLGKQYGDKEIASTQFGVSAKLNFGAPTLALAYVNTAENKGKVLDGGIINSFGGANALIISQAALHANFADTQSYMAGLIYDFKSHGVNLLAMAKYFHYDIGEFNGYQSGHSWSMDELDFDFIYKPASLKNTTFRLRTNNNTNWLELENGAGGLSFNEVRVIAYHNF